MVSDWYLNDILHSLYRSIYLKLPLTVLLSPSEIPLNGPVVPNDTKWYSVVCSGIPLVLFCKGTYSVYFDLQMNIYKNRDANSLQVFQQRSNTNHAKRCGQTDAFWM